MSGKKFKLKDIEHLAKQVSKKASFPINNFDELAKGLGGKNASFTYEGKGRKVTEAQQIPAELYPIESENDFVAKMASLRGRSGDEAEDMPRGKKLDSLPPEAGEPPQIPESERLPKGKAGYKGFKKQP